MLDVITVVRNAIEEHRGAPKNQSYTEKRKLGHIPSSVSHELRIEVAMIQELLWLYSGDAVMFFLVRLEVCL
jgi:hypothetical protein